MKPISKSIITVALVLLSSDLFAQAPVVDFDQSSRKSASMEERLRKLERMVENRNLVELAVQIENLQKEMQKLLGEMEVQAHKIEEIKRRQKDLYVDLDRRIQRLEGGGAKTGRDRMPGDNQTANMGMDTGQPGPGTQFGMHSGDSGGMTGMPKQEGQDKQEYDKAFNLLRKRNYGGAIASFKSFLSRFPDSEYADNAQYWIGEANFVQRNFDEALVEFGNVLNHFPDSPKYPEAMLKIGLAHLELKNWNLARNVFDEIMNRFPNTVESRIAGKNRQRMKLEGH